MSHKPKLPKAQERRLAAVLAEFDDPDKLVEAARRVHADGYQKFDAHTPFPIHGMDDAMGIRMTALPWITLTFAAIGVTSAVAMIYYMNKVWYPFFISGKPLFSLPTAAPIMFEFMVLLAAISTLVGMLVLNGLPYFSNPLFRSERFHKVTDDRFFISILAKDPKCRADKTVQFLKSLGAVGVEECYTDPTTYAIPGRFRTIATFALLIALIPVTFIAWKRGSPVKQPRFHLIQDMDFQPKFKDQRTSTLFADGRTMRPQVAGTVPRGNLEDDDRYYRGLEPGGAAGLPVAAVSFQPGDGGISAGGAAAKGAGENSPADATKPTAIDPEATKNSPGRAEPTTPDGKTPATAAGGEAQPDPLEGLPWVTEFPVDVTPELMTRGRERYNIYCATCHGLGGDGDGLITERAMALQQGTWIRPVTFHSDALRQQQIGRLFHSISNGVRKMPGYADQIPVRDRWAILLYVRALQRSRHATLEDVPPEFQNQLTETP